jgi:hypothetical protein
MKKTKVTPTKTAKIIKEFDVKIQLGGLKCINTWAEGVFECKAQNQADVRKNIVSLVAKNKKDLLEQINNWPGVNYWDTESTEPLWKTLGEELQNKVFRKQDIKILNITEYKPGAPTPKEPEQLKAARIENEKSKHFEALKQCPKLPLQVTGRVVKIETYGKVVHLSKNGKPIVSKQSSHATVVLDSPVAWVEKPYKSHSEKNDLSYPVKIRKDDKFTVVSNVHRFGIQDEDVGKPVIVTLKMDKQGYRLEVFNLSKKS